MSPNDLHKELGKGKFRSLYYFHGAEDFRIREAEKAVISKYLPKPHQRTNYTSLSASKNKLKDILTELSIVPMLGERQIYTISDIQALKPDKIENIIAMLTPPDPNRVVIFSSPSAKSPKKTTKIFKFLSSKSSTVEFPKLRVDSAAKRIKNFFGAKNIAIDPQAIKLLTETTAGDFGGLNAELNKLSDFAGEDGTITREVVLKVSSDYQAYQIYELSGHVAMGDLDKALTVINTLINQGEKGAGMTFWLGEHFVGLYLTQNNKKFGNRDISWKYRGQLNVFNNAQLEEIIRLIAESDFEIRDNVRPIRIIIEELIIRICNLRKKSSKR